jgi:hypothetical protein
MARHSPALRPGCTVFSRIRTKRAVSFRMHFVFSSICTNLSPILPSGSVRLQITSAVTAIALAARGVKNRSLTVRPSGRGSSQARETPVSEKSEVGAQDAPSAPSSQQLISTGIRLHLSLIKTASAQCLAATRFKFLRSRRESNCPIRHFPVPPGSFPLRWCNRK